MREKSLLNIVFLQKIIYKEKNLERIKKYNISLYIFGSALYNKNPKDIDILILYPRSTVYFEEIFNFKNKIKILFEKKLLIDIDILILSYEEEQEIMFIKNESAMKFIDYNI